MGLISQSCSGAVIGTSIAAAIHHLGAMRGACAPTVTWERGATLAANAACVLLPSFYGMMLVAGVLHGLNVRLLTDNSLHSMFIILQSDWPVWNAAELAILQSACVCHLPGSP